MSQKIYLPALSGPEFDALLAGLRALQKMIDTGSMPNNIVSILTNDGEHEGMWDLDELDTLAERINSTHDAPESLTVLREVLPLAQEAVDAREQESDGTDSDMLKAWQETVDRATALVMESGANDAQG